MLENTELLAVMNVALIKVSTTSEHLLKAGKNHLSLIQSCNLDVTIKYDIQWIICSLIFSNHKF
jgi:hypothetical protein